MRSNRMSEATRLVTAEELARFPDDGYRYELVEGRVIRMSPVSFDHGRIVVQLATLLHRLVQQQPVGVVVMDVGFTLASNPDTVRGPDIAFVRRDRVPPKGARGFFKGPPDVAIEVLSPDDRPGEVRAKTDEYPARGVRLVVVIDPDEKTATTIRPNGPHVILREEDDLLDLNEVIPGFSCRLREIFE
ncbi:MAG TPA: Uma2 family endonuclease [Vicinamibacterales bacterium]|nr:Uma2 family endonuclease [Vicinamibacterales bacterium]